MHFMKRNAVSACQQNWTVQFKYLIFVYSVSKTLIIIFVFNNKGNYCSGDKKPKERWNERRGMFGLFIYTPDLSVH